MPVQAADTQAEQQPAADTPLPSLAGALQEPQPSSSSKAQKRKLVDEIAVDPQLDVSVTTAAAAKRRAAETAAELPSDSTPTAAAAVLDGLAAEPSRNHVTNGQFQSDSGSGSSEEVDSADASVVEEEGSDDDDESTPPRSHPYGVQPWGNYYLSQVPEIRTAGLGVLSGLSDDVILGLLELLPAADLARLGLASKALYCFAHTNDLWKALVLQELGGDFEWRGTWRETYLAHAAPGYKLGSHKPLQVSGFYSDLLNQPWFCATVELQREWLEVDNIDRRTGLTPNEFQLQYESRNRPVLLTDGAAGWPALQKWSLGYLAAAFAGRPVIVGNAAWRFGSYLAYCRNGAELDEMPLYMFDKAFASACPHLSSDYWVPSAFTEDLFEVLGEDKRPDYRWLIIGPHRSGSSFHVDPNATCAWNAVVSGMKKWILFPPGSPPPGVHPSPDGADVAAPVSIIEWFLNFYDEARNSKVPPIECICKPGEVLYVPRGWWHCVLNIGHTVAVTQNFVSSTGLPRVLDFLRPGRKELVSGCGMEDRGSLHDRFVSALQQQRPEVLAAVRQQQEQQLQQRQAEHKLSELFKSTRQHPHQQQQQHEERSGRPHRAAAAAAAGVQGDGDAVGIGSAAGAAGFSFGVSVGCESDVQQQQQQQQLEGQGDGPGVGFSFGFSL